MDLKQPSQTWCLFHLSSQWREQRWCTRREQRCGNSCFKWKLSRGVCLLQLFAGIGASSAGVIVADLGHSVEPRGGRRLLFGRLVGRGWSPHSRPGVWAQTNSLGRALEQGAGQLELDDLTLEFLAVVGILLLYGGGAQAGRWTTVALYLRLGGFYP